MALDEDEYSSCVIDCLDYGDQTRARESAEIGDVSDEREKHLMKSFKCDPQRQQCKPHGLDEHRDLEINHYTCSTIDSQISTITNDTNVSTVWLINTKDKLLFDTSSVPFVPLDCTEHTN